MRTLKNLAIFVAGGAAMAFAFGASAVYRTEHPEMDDVVYETDAMKVTRISTQTGDGTMDFATIVYK